MSTTDNEAKAKDTEASNDPAQMSAAEKSKSADGKQEDSAQGKSDKQGKSDPDATEKVAVPREGSMARTDPRGSSSNRRRASNRTFVGSAAAAAAATRKRPTPSAAEPKPPVGATAGPGPASGARSAGADPSMTGAGGAAQFSRPRPDAGYRETAYPGGAANVAGDRNARVGRMVGPRRVKLTMQRIDPWSAMKISFLVSVALGIAGVIMVGAIWLVLSGMGVFGTVNDFIVQLTSGEDSASSFDLMDYIGLGRVLLLAVVFGVINVFLLTALSTLSAFLYNICSALVGGMALTLSDE